jgi:hypothetical protein
LFPSHELFRGEVTIPLKPAIIPTEIMGHFPTLPLR